MSTRSYVSTVSASASASTSPAGPTMGTSTPSTPSVSITNTPLPGFVVNVVLNVSLAGWSAAIGEALRCDVANAVGAGFLGVPSPLRVRLTAITSLTESFVTRFDPSDGAVGNGNDATCAARCINNGTNSTAMDVIVRGQNASATVPCISRSGLCCALAQHANVCFAMNGTDCSSGASPLLDATCALSQGDCVPFTFNLTSNITSNVTYNLTRVCTAIATVSRSVSLCARPPAASTLPAFARNASLVLMQLFIPRNASNGASNYSSAGEVVFAFLSVAAAAGSSGFPALTAALAANCAAYVGGCNGYAAVAAGANNGPAVGIASAVAVPFIPATFTPTAPRSGDADLAIGLIILFFAIAVFATIGFYIIKAYKAQRNSVKPRTGQIVDYEDLFKGNFIKSAPIGGRNGIGIGGTSINSLQQTWVSGVDLLFGAQPSSLAPLAQSPSSRIFTSVGPAGSSEVAPKVAASTISVNPAYNLF